MKIKRTAALFLALVMLWPAGSFSPALALDASNLVKETGSIIQRSTAAPPSVPSSFRSDYADAAPRFQGDNHNTSWAYAAAAALEASARKEGLTSTFSEGHMFFALSSDSSNNYGFDRRYNGPGNRAMVTAYLMRSVLAGPVSNYPTSATQTGISSLADFTAIKKDANVSGVTYIPSLSETADTATRALFMARVKAAVRDYGAVAASLYMDTAKLYDRTNGSGKVYYYGGSAAADHTVAIVGWDDGVTTDVTVTTGTAENPVTTTTTYTGAFLVRDSLVGSGSTYWVSYGVALSGLYFIEGFLASDPFEATYEYDPFGFTNGTGFNSNTAWYANVFTSATEAERLEAVSFFLTGENASYEIYFIPSFTETKNLTSGLTAANLVASGTKALPGYYTVMVSGGGTLLMPPKGKKCAVVVKVTNPYDTAPVPVQSTSLYKTGNVGRSYMSSNGESWLDAYAMNQSVVCLKAHVDKDIDIPLTGVTMPQTEDKVTAIGGVNYPTLYIAPGQSYSMGPLFTPLNATDTDPAKTEWWLGDENASNFVKIDPNAEPPGDGEDEPPVYFNAKTGMLKIAKENFSGVYSVRVKVYNKAGTYYEATGIVSARAVAVEKVTIDKTSLSMKAGSTATIKATVTPSDASAHTVTWKVAKAYDSASKTYTDYDRYYDAAEPYREGSPIVTVKNGAVSALMDGTCYVYAEVTQEGVEPIRSEPCEIKIDKVAPTGITISKKAIEMSSGSKTTLTATVKPTTASNKKVIWSSDNPAVVEVDPVLGILTAKSEGKAVITAQNAAGNSYDCAVTVTAMPSLILGKGKSSTLTLVGAGSKDEVKWEFIPVSDVENTLASDILTTSKSGVKLKVTGKDVGSELLRAYITAESYDENGDPISSRVIREQTWRIETVVPLTKMEFRDATGAPVKKLTLCVDSKNPSRNMSVTLSVAPVKPADATELGYVWSSKTPDIASVEVVPDPSSPTGAKAVITAHKAGSAKITVTSWNGKKKLTITVKVLDFPTSVTLNKSGTVSLAVGKAVSAKGSVNSSKNVNKEVRYFIEDGGNNTEPHTADNPIASVNDRGKVTARREGTVRLVARGAPFDSTAPSASVVVECKILVTGVTISISPAAINVGETAVITAAASPSNATAGGLKLTLSNPMMGTLTDNGDGTWTFTAKAAGSGKITASSTDNPKKLKSVSFTVRAPLP